MKKYDVVFVLPMPTLKIVGGYKMIYEYANYIANKNHKVCIVYNALKGKNSKNLPKKLIYFMRVIIGKIGPRWFKLEKGIDKLVIPDYEEKYMPYCERIVASTAVSARFVNSIAEKSKKKYYFIQDFENWEMSDEDLFQTYKYPMTKIAVAKWLKRKIEEVSKDTVVYIPNGINTSIFNIKKKQSERHQHSIAMLYHLDKRKGCEVAFEVIKKLKAIYPDLIVNMFGSPENSKEWPEWINYTRNASPLEVSAIMNDSAVFLCTSRPEGYGLTGLESLFCGCQLVTTNCNGILEYATENSALICNVDDVKALTDSVIKLFNDNKLKEEMLFEFESYKDLFEINKSKEKFYEVLMG